MLPPVWFGTEVATDQLSNPFEVQENLLVSECNIKIGQV